METRKNGKLSKKIEIKCIWKGNIFKIFFLLIKMQNIIFGINLGVNLIVGGCIVYNLYYINVNLVELRDVIENILFRE